MSASKAKRPRLTIRVAAIWRKKWVRIAAAAIGIPSVLVAIVATYYYVQFARLLDAQLHGEHTRVLPRIFARPFELRVGESLSAQQLVDRLNDLGYSERSRVEKEGEFTIGRDAIVLIPRDGDHKGAIVRATFETPKPLASAPPRAAPAPVARIAGLTVAESRFDRVTLDPPLLTALINTGREKRRQVPLSAIPSRMRNCRWTRCGHWSR